MKLSTYDSDQIEKYCFDEENTAKRVVIVGGDFKLPEVKLDTSDIKFPAIPEQKTIEIPVIVKELEIKEIQVPQIIIQKEIEIKEIQVPCVITEVKEIIKEVPVYITKTEFIDKPVIIKEVEYKSLPKSLIICLAAQAIGSILMLLKLLILK